METVETGLNPCLHMPVYRYTCFYIHTGTYIHMHGVDKLVKVGGLKLRAKRVERFSLLIIHNATMYYVFA